MSDTTSPLRQFDGPPVDPRFRRRWAEARRAEGRRRLQILAQRCRRWGQCSAVVSGLLHSPLLRVRDVIVIGNTHTPRAEVLAAAGMAAGDGTVLMVDAGPAGARRAVDALPWVAGATFERRWPWTLVIRLTERSPVARVASLGVVDLVDKSGRVLEASPPMQRARTASDHGRERGAGGRLRLARYGSEPGRPGGAAGGGRAPPRVPWQNGN